MFEKLPIYKSVTLVTRCTRPENLPTMFSSVKFVTERLAAKQIATIWAIGCDSFRYNPDPDEMIRYCNECLDYGVNALWCGTHRSESNEDYGCTVASKIIQRAKILASLNNYQLNLVYLLDDDTYLLDTFVQCIEMADQHIPTIWNIAWGGKVIKPHQFLVVNEKSTEFAHGIDSAQFVIPIDLLEQAGWFTGGMAIDYNTLRNAIGIAKSYKIVDIVGAMYNGINSKRWDYDDLSTKHPCMWFDHDKNKIIDNMLLGEKTNVI